MPSYFYHLKIELYPTPQPNLPAERRDDVWLPPKDLDVFDVLPDNAPLTWQQQDRPSKDAPVATQSPSPKQTHAQAKPTTKQGLIDCGAPRPTTSDAENDGALLGDQHRRQRSLSSPARRFTAAINPKTAARDWRFDRIYIQSHDVRTHAQMAAGPSSAAATALGPSLSSAGKSTKAKFVNTSVGGGIVHLYREKEETPELKLDGREPPSDCTTLCIPAVPSYVSPGEFLGFVGEKWKNHISHYRMVMTGKLSRYMVLMKFRDSKQAQLFRQEFDGKVFNTMEPETCNVACIRSITFETPTQPNESFPDLSRDPFTPSSSAAMAALKPFPPPTPSLIELPTCPVCLERMDDTTGLLTIPCQHVFHCSCLQKWKGSGCPVCRHTNPPSGAVPNGPWSTSNHASSLLHDPSNPDAQPFGSHVSNLCSVCDSADDLWICLLCGNVGCGRYKGGHAKEHWKDTAHTFSLELVTQHVWDYAGDMWVHRLIREKGDGKLVELPGHHDTPQDRRDDDDVVPRAKLDNIGLEYTHLIISQMDSQRAYFQEMLDKAADKATKASAAAEKASQEATEALSELRLVKEEMHVMKSDTIPSLEKDLERERARAAKSTELARKLGSSLQEEKKVSEGLLKRVEHVNRECEGLRAQFRALGAENADLRDQNHDLSMFISGQQKLREMEAEGRVEQEELEGGTTSVGKKKKKGKSPAKG